MSQHSYTIHNVSLECGEVIAQVEIAYNILGDIAKHPDRIIWICHALTANSNPAEWWPEVVGKDKLFDPEVTPIVCANVIGSCYGTTGPMSINPSTGKPYLLSFPLITVRDMVRAHEELRKHLGIERIFLAVGGSIGGFQTLEWECCFPGTAEHIVLIACSAKATPWVVAFNQSQRLALKADPTFTAQEVDGGKAGLKAARSIALLSYRGNKAYNLSQHDGRNDIINGHRAASYQDYQGEKLVNRFDAYSYYTLTQSIDSHNVGRNRGSVADALKSIKAKTLVVGIDNDILFPTEDQKEIARNIPNAQYAEIHSDFGHDGFLLEWEQLQTEIGAFTGIKPGIKKAEVNLNRISNGYSFEAIHFPTLD